MLKTFMLMMPLLGIIIRYFPSSSITLTSPLSSKFPPPWTSQYITIISCPSNISAFLFFTHSRLGLIHYRENRSPYHPATESPILPAPTPCSSFSYQKFLSPYLQSIPPVSRHLQLTLQPFLILFQPPLLPRMDSLGTNWSLFIAEPGGGFSILPSRSLCNTQLTPPSPSSWATFSLEPLSLLASGRSHTPDVFLPLQPLIFSVP